MRNLVVVGGSLAGLRAAEGARKAGHTGAIDIVGGERHLPYDRTRLSKSFDIEPTTHERFLLRHTHDLDAQWHLGQRAVALHAAAREIELGDGTALGFDGLVIATGAVARGLPGIPAGLGGVHSLRTWDDAQGIEADLVPGARVVIIGAGFIGTELASSCRARGLSTTVITPLPVLATALGPASDELTRAMSARMTSAGVDLREGCGVDGVEADEHVRAVRLTTGEVVPADVVVVAVGAAPDTSWLVGSPVEVADGVVCGVDLRVAGMDDVVAAGDVARWPHPAFGGRLIRLEHWNTATEQGLAAGHELVTRAGARFGPVPSFWSDQFGLTVQGVGMPALADTAETVLGALDEPAFAVEFRCGDLLVGAVTSRFTKHLLACRRQLAGLAHYPGV